jgi:chromosome partitioning protein
MAATTNNPKVISVLNMKGGVGKTTLSVNVAYILASFHNKKVLIVDIDPQFNATQYLVSQEEIIDHFESKKTILDIIMPQKEEKIELVKAKKKASTRKLQLSDFTINILDKSNGARLDLIPSTVNLIEIENSPRGAEHHLKQFIKKYCKLYDIVIIDCPPTIGIHTLSAFLASAYYLIPLKPDYLSSLGLSLLEKALEKYRKADGHKLKSLGVVFTMVDLRPELTFKIMKEIKVARKDVITAYSSLSTQVAQSFSNLDNFYSGNGRYQTEFKDITQEIVNKL